MSGDYTDSAIIKVEIGVAGLPIVNGNVDHYIGCPTTTPFFKVLALETIVHVVGATATQTIALQLSNSAGSFASPTVLVTHTLTSGDAIGAVQFTRVADHSTDVLKSPQMLRLRHNAGSTDATLRYSAYVYVTAMHY